MPSKKQELHDYYYMALRLRDENQQQAKRIAELEAERDESDKQAEAGINTAYRLGYDRARAAAFEEAAGVIDYAGFIDVQSNGEERPAGDLIRALATTPPTMVAVERSMLAGLGEVLKESLATTHNHRCTTGTLTSCGYYRCNEIRAALAIITKALGTK